MKISNKYIEIKNGNKKYNFKNFMMNNYLKYFVDSSLTMQSNISVEYLTKTMRAVCLKIDSPFEQEITPDTNLNSTDFDVCFYYSSRTQAGNSKQVEISYVYQLKDIFYYNGVETNDKSLINGKKIYAIGFSLSEESDIKAYIDVSAYNIRINDNEIFDITRVDTFESDAECVGQEYPIHLAPIGKFDIKKGPSYAHLYSIGLGYTKGNITNEYIIGQDINLIRNDDFTYSFNLNNPSGENEIYPRNDLYPNETLYPSEENFKYVIYKYKIYGILEEEGSPTGYTGEEYTMNYEISKTGDFNIKTILENITKGR